MDPDVECWVELFGSVVFGVRIARCSLQRGCPNVRTKYYPLYGVLCYSYVALHMLPALAVTVTRRTECLSMNNDLEKNSGTCTGLW